MKNCVPSGTHRNSSLLVLGWGWETGRQETGRGWGPHNHREQLAPLLAGRQWGRAVAWLSTGLPGGCMPTAECRWADSWPGPAGQLGSWSACWETEPRAAHSESSGPGESPPPGQGGCVAHSSDGLSVGCEGEGSEKERLVCGWQEGKREARGLGSWPGRGKERCLLLVGLVPQGRGPLGAKNEACGQDTPGLFSALPLEN